MFEISGKRTDFFFLNIETNFINWTFEIYCITHVK